MSATSEYAREILIQGSGPGPTVSATFSFVRHNRLRNRVVDTAGSGGGLIGVPRIKPQLLPGPDQVLAHLVRTEQDLQAPYGSLDGECAEIANSVQGARARVGKDLMAVQVVSPVPPT